MQAGEKLAHALVALGTTGAAGKVDSWLPGRGSKRLAPQARAALFEEAQSILQQSLSTFTVRGRRHLRCCVLNLCSVFCVGTKTVECSQTLQCTKFCQSAQVYAWVGLVLQHVSSLAGLVRSEVAVRSGGAGGDG